MRRLLIAYCWLLLLSLCLPPSPSPSVADDTSELRALVEKYFAVFAGRDLDAFMALWSDVSPDSASSKRTLQQPFAANEYTFEVPAISRDGDSPSQRA